MNNIHILSTTKDHTDQNVIINQLNKNLINDYSLSNLELTIHLVNKNTIQNLNHQYRKLNRPTDVLSFPIFDNLEKIKQQTIPKINIGDIFICPQIARQQAKENHKQYIDEVIFLAEHGLKHLLGFHHK